MASSKLAEAGASGVMALVTHGILSGPALSRLSKTSSKELSRLIVTNTIPQSIHEESAFYESGRLEVLDVSHVLAETIRRSHYGESISYLFVSPFLFCVFLFDAN